jgi:AcrR family transcriptional regulator
MVTKIRIWSWSYPMRAVATRKDLPALILKAADRLLARYGYRKMTMEDLAKEVGIGKGTIYLHFPSKQEVVLSHVDQIVDQLEQRLRVIAQSKITFAEKLTEMLAERVLFRFDRVQHYTQSLDDLLADMRDALLRRREQHFKREAQVLATVLRDGQQAGTFAVQDPLALADALILATNALLPYSLSVRDLGARSRVEKKARQLARLLLNGLFSRSAEAGSLATSRAGTKRR